MAQGRNHWATGPVVQWSFLQFKKQAGSKVEQPTPQFLHSATQVGSKIVVFGGCSYFGEPLRSLFVYDTLKFEWSAPSESTRFEEDHPGARYSHSATLVESHPPKILVYGGMLGGGTFEFDSPDGVDEQGPERAPQRLMMNWRRKGRQNMQHEEMDESVYLLSLNAESWVWSKPLIAGTRSKGQKPPSRAEHSACKTSTNEVTIFGGWCDAPQGPSSDLWTFNYVDMEWKAVETSGIHPRQRYRHTAEMVAGKMYILGGSDNGEDVADASRGNLSLHELDFGTMQWSHPALRGMNPFPRSGHGSSVIGANTLAVFGGKRSNELFFNDLVLIDCGSWCTTVVNAVEDCLPTPIGNCSMTNVGNKLFVFGGTDAKGACYNDIRSLDIGLYLSSSDITVGEGASSDYCFKILIIGDACKSPHSLSTLHLFLPSTPSYSLLSPSFLSSSTSLFHSIHLSPSLFLSISSFSLSFHCSRGQVGHPHAILRGTVSRHLHQHHRHRLQQQDDPRRPRHLQARDLGHGRPGALLDHHGQLLPRRPGGHASVRRRPARLL